MPGGGGRGGGAGVAGRVAEQGAVSGRGVATACLGLTCYSLSCACLLQPAWGLTARACLVLACYSLPGAYLLQPVLCLPATACLGLTCYSLPGKLMSAVALLPAPPRPRPQG